MLLAAACHPEAQPLLREPDAAPQAIRASCSLVARRCSRCHTLDRIANARIGAPIGWRRYVRRMRLIPGSGIPPEEEPALVDCLVYRTFGPDGLAQLRSPKEQP